MGARIAYSWLSSDGSCKESCVLSPELVAAKVQVNLGCSLVSRPGTELILRGAEPRWLQEQH